MYKVLIVDDEVLVRVGLKTTIQWEEMGFIIASEASNGEQGYENYVKYKPDVIITDIKMPKQDGLWLVERIREEDQEAIILVLTCYDEFSYARKALKVGADDYILKTEIEDEELIKLMVNIKEKLDAQYKAKAHKENQPNIQDLTRSIFSDLMKQGFQIDESLHNALGNLNFPAQRSQYAFMSISIVHPNQKNKDTDKINHAVMNIIFGQFHEKSVTYMEGQQGSSYLIFLAREELTFADIKRIFYAAANGAMQYFDIFLNAVCSPVFVSLGEAQVVYQDYAEKAQILFYQNSYHVIMETGDIKFSEPSVLELKKAYHGNFMEAIGHEMMKTVNELLEEQGQFFEHNKVSPMIVRIFYSNMVGDLFGGYGIYMTNRELFDTHKVYHYQMENTDTLEQIHTLLITLCSNLIHEIEAMRFINSKYLIHQAENFIEYHYMDKISLDDVARELNISKHYLCSVFKKETGENMSLYINRLRIEKAKQMLLESDIKIKEIFEKIGYSDQQYFSKVFKKITGMTVIEYKERLGRK